jgi:PD-(D/E)XK nuclease superfamily
VSDNGQIRWHATGLAVFQQCPEKFRRRYVEGEREEHMSAGSIIGRALHHAAELGVQAQMEGQRAQLDFLLESAFAHFNGLVDEDARGAAPIPWDEDPGSLLARKDDLRHLIELWWHKAPAWFERWGAPTMAENHFKVELWGHVVTGQIDMATEYDVVVDWKSGLRFLTDKRAEREMQKLVYPAAYERITGRFPSLLVFAQLLRQEPTKTRPRWSYRLNIQEQLVDEAQKELLRRLLDDYQAQADAGIYPLNIQSGLCSPDYCPFWRSCPAHLIKPLAEREEPAPAEVDTVEEAVEG